MEKCTFPIKKRNKLNNSPIAKRETFLMNRKKQVQGNHIWTSVVSKTDELRAFFSETLPQIVKTTYMVAVTSFLQQRPSSGQYSRGCILLRDHIPALLCLI